MRSASATLTKAPPPPKFKNTQMWPNPLSPHGGYGIPEVLHEDRPEGGQVLSTLLRTAPNKAPGSHAGRVSVHSRIFSDKLNPFDRFPPYH